jgi:pimeloyl-ACP methyl ester carboxylesterase
MPTVNSNGVQLYYTDTGKGPETIVFSHSYLADHSHFNPQIDALKKHYRCIAFDHRGHGRSKKPASGYDMENLYQDAVSVIEALKCAPCHFIGLSTGGFIGLRIGIRRPDLVKSLILMDTSADAEAEGSLGRYKLMLFIFRWIGFRPVIKRALPLFFGPKFLNDPDRQNEVAEWRQRLISNDSAAVSKFGRGIFSRESMYDQIDKIQTPTLVIVGEKDIVTPVDRAGRIAEKIPGATLEVIPDAGHLCTVEEPAAVNSVIERFLAEQI